MSIRSAFEIVAVAGRGSRLLAMVLFLGLSGCLSDEPKKADVPTGNASGGTTTPPPATSNRAPTISGSPVTTAKTSVAYSFQPSAADADGDPLTFAIRGKPSWASFSIATGRLSGTPGAADAGTYANIEILVSDGQAQAVLPAFSITVVPPVVGSATLNWQPPTYNEDGTALVDLAGYVVRYGNNPASLDKALSLTNPGLTSVVIEDLVEGTWYFALVAVNSSGIESRPTAAVAKTIS